MTSLGRRSLNAKLCVDGFARVNFAVGRLPINLCYKNSTGGVHALSVAIQLGKEDAFTLNIGVTT